jgi:hypothetical protein
MLLDRLFGLDTRALAVFRVGLGLHLLLNLLLWLPTLRDHLTDAGLLPTSLVGEVPVSAWYSLHHLSGSASWQVLLFGAAAAAAVALVLGFHTRVATFVSWVLLLSLNQRNLLAVDSSDFLLACLLFWGMFLPLGARASLDSRGARETPGRVTNIFSAGLVLQLVQMYACAGLVKWNPAWESGQAVRRILETHPTTLDLGHLLATWTQGTGLCRMATYGTVVFEVAVAGLLLFPWRTTRVRLAVLPALAVMHVAFGLCLDIGTFWARCLVALVILVPAVVWDRVWPAVDTSSPARPLPPLARALGAGALVWTLAWNVSSLTPGHPFAGTRAGRIGVSLLGLEQNWHLFSNPYAGYTELVAQRPDGTWIDLYQGRYRTTETGYRQFKFLESLSQPGFDRFRVRVLERLVHQARRDGRLEGVVVRAELRHRIPGAPSEVRTFAWLTASPAFQPSAEPAPRPWFDLFGRN